MSQLQRLNLFGIRSFGPEEKDLQKIKFFTPVTLIQGQNGCGKTSIIEAIKFAVTGDLPGGTTVGQGFVYDPRLARAFESRGQVKLRVSDTKGEAITVTKSVQVTQKPNNKMEFKRLDSTISRGNEHISGKCIDIDTEMCLSLGVAKPILNNVIFCHQQDSNWPLEEGKKLKEKFDEIFDATKYNKCLVVMTKFAKEGAEKLKLFQNDVSHLLDTKKYVENKREILGEKENKLKDLVEEISINKVKLKSITVKIDEIFTIEQDFSKLCADIEIKKKEIKNLVDHQEELLTNMTEFPGTDEELNIKVNKFEQDLLCLQTDIDILIAKKRDIEENERKLRQKVNEHQMKLGSIQAEEKQNSVRVENRNKLIRKSIKDFQLEIEESILDDQVNQLISDLNEKLENKNVNIKLLEASMETEEKMLQNDIDKIREEYAQLKHNIVLKSKNISESKDELRKIQHEIEELNSAGDQLKLSDNKLKRLDRDLSSLESSVNTNDLKSKIDSEKKKQKELEDRLTLVDSEVQTLQQFTSLQTELDLNNENLVTKQNELQKLKNKHEKALNHVFENNIPNSDLKKGVEIYQIIQSKKIKDLTNKINDKQREVLKLESSLSSQREKLNEKEKELTNNQKELSVHCEDKELDDITEETQKCMKDLQNNRGIYFSSKYIYQKFIKQFQTDNPCCPVCKQNVEEKAYAETIINDLSKKIENVPNKLLEIDNKLAQEQKKYEILLGLKPMSEKLQKLKKEVPLLKSETEKCEISFKKSSEELETFRNDILQPQKNEKIGNSIIGDVTLMDQLQRELQRIKQEISSLNLRMPKNESNRGIQEALSEQETLKIDIKTSRNNIESSQNKLSQHIERLQRIKEQKNELITQQLKIKQSLQGKDNLITRATEIEAKLVELESNIQELEIEVKSTKSTLDDSMTHKENLLKKHREKLREARNHFTDLQTTIRNIDNYQKDIDNFIKKDITAQINAINDKIKTIRNDIEEYSSKKNKIYTSVDELKTQISGSKINFRELQDNIKLREKRKEQSELEKELEVLEKKLGKNDIKAVRKEKARLVEVESTLQEATHRSEGQKGELQTHIKELKTELELPKNAKINLNYKKKLLECMLHERATLNLKNFIKAMDWALMQFHRQRMIQINSIIKELWRAIYKGNDIDHIEIKTDDINTVGNDKRKVYNYRIVQVKNSAELDMRGRCSAGQRVLASLIIRIALSETFSSNCGILTLDEPTTNLDRENIHSLCEALVELIQQKRQQKNFQLVIITHDQDFVDRLTRSESLQHYYVIRRNDEGKSVIGLKC